MPRILNIPLVAGLKQGIEPKYAPSGVLALATNLRVQKDGRLVSRTGYLVQSNGTSTNGLQAYDLHEFHGRLLALGSDASDPFPTDVFEFVDLGVNRTWRGSDQSVQLTLSPNCVLCPFTNLSETCGTSLVGDGISHASVAAGGGYVALAWVALTSGHSFVKIVRQSDGQTIHYERVSTTGLLPQLTFSVDTFYLLLRFANGDVLVRDFTPGTDSLFQSFVTVVAGGTLANAVDIVPVTSATTGRIAVAFGKTAGSSVIVYQSNGATLGAAATTVVSFGTMVIDADQADNTINLYGIVASAGSLRTFNLTTGALTIGPTVTTAGSSGSMCRLPAFAGGVQAIAVATNTSADSVAIVVYSQSTHGVIAGGSTLQKLVLRGRLISAQSGVSKRAVAFTGFVAPELPATTSPVSGSTVATNVLVYASATIAHVVARDPQNAVDLGIGLGINFMLDASTGKLAWVSAKNTGTGGASGVGGPPIAQPTVTLVDFQSAKRRQSARYGGLLYLTGGNVQAYDGSWPTELYFNELPGIYSVTPSGGGALTPSAQYDYVHHWEFARADGSFEQSGVSAVKAGNTGPAQGTNTFSVSVPHSVKCALGAFLFGGTVLSVLSRTVWDPVSATKGSQFRRCKVTPVPAGMANYGAPLAVIDTTADVSLATQGVVYTQGTSNALSGPLENNSPEPCSYIVADASRLFTGGLVRPFETQVSKATNIEQPFGFSNASPFSNLVSEPVKGVHSIGNAKLVFTTNQLFALSADGPDDQGGGALDPPQEIPTPAGLHDWRSFLKVPDGLYFQLDDEKLYKLPIGGSAPVWAGVDIQDVLASFPVIVGAARCKKDDVAMFACTNSANTDSNIAVQSLRTGVWTVDDPPLGGAAGISSIVNFGDLVAYVATGGFVYIQSAAGFADEASTVIVCQWKTHPIYPFELGGYGECCDVLLTGEYRSAGTLALRVSYDDGVSFTTYDSFTLTRLTVGQTVQRKWALQQSDTTSVVFEWTFTPSAPGAGFICHHAALLANPATGKLRELDATEMA